MLADQQARRAAGGLFEFTSHFRRCIGLQIKHILMARRTRQKDQNDAAWRFVQSRTGVLRRLSATSQERRQSKTEKP